MTHCLLYSFHTYDYARHFVSACTRILGLEGTPEGVEDQGRLTRVAAVWPFHYFDHLHLSCRSDRKANNTLSLFESLVTELCICFGFQFPIGIDSDRFIRALEVPEVIQHMKELKERFAGRKVRKSQFPW